MTSCNETASKITVLEENLPTVTYSMLLDFLRSYTIIQAPAQCRREFRWFTAIAREESPVAAPSSLSESRVIFISSEANAEGLLKELSTAFVLILSDLPEGSEKPAWRETYKDRILVIKQQDRFSYFIFVVQAYFMQLLIWENEIDRIVLRKGSVEELFEASSPLLKNFCYMNDAKYNLIAYTKNIEAPDEVHSELIKVGCLSEKIIRKRHMASARKHIYTEEPNEKSPFVRMHYPIYISHLYFGAVVMVCHENEYSKGLEDLFRILLKRVELISEYIWKRQIQIDSPHFFFFQKLLGGEQLAPDYLKVQMSLTSIPENGQIKLLVIELTEEDRAKRLANITSAAARINHGDCHTFLYRGDLLVLCYAIEGDSQLSHRKSAADLERLIYIPFKAISGVSQIFERITDIDMAYKQAKVTLGLKNTIKSELFAIGEERDKGVYLFEDALVYYLVGNTEIDTRFLEFSFSHTILQKIYEEDKRDNTNNLALFWFYLHHERNATMVAQRLHMHRNTVLYHIEKIQKRFDFNLSLQSAREKMLIDFKVFFLQSNHDSLERIFGDPQKESEHDGMGAI